MAEIDYKKLIKEVAGKLRPRYEGKSDDKHMLLAGYVVRIAVLVFLLMSIVALLAGAWAVFLALIVGAFLVKQAETALKAETEKTIANLKEKKELWGPVDVIKIIAIGLLFLMSIVFVTSWAILLAPWGLGRSFAGALVITLLIGLFIVLVIIRTTTVVPNRPHSLAIITIFGSKTHHSVKDGKYPTLPGIVDYLVVKAEKVDQDFDPIKVLTKDNIEVKAEPMIFWLPDPYHLDDYIIAGGEEGVKTLIDNEVPQLTANWIKSKELEEVLELKKPTVDEIMEQLKKAKARQTIGRVEPESSKPEEKQPVEVKLGIIVINFNLQITGVDEDVKAALKQKEIEGQQQVSEMVEIETEIKQAHRLEEEAKKAGQKITFEKAYKIVKIIKTNREQGQSPILGLDEAFGKGTAGVAEAALMAFTGLMKKPADAEPVIVSKGQQRKLAKKPAREEPETATGPKEESRRTKGPKRR